MATTKDPLDDFRNTLFLIWRRLNLPTPTRRQYAIAMAMANPANRRLMVSGFRNISKSWIAAAFCAHTLRQEIEKNPQFNILVVSASKMRADNFTTFLLRIIHEMPEYQHLVPRDGQRSSKTGFDVGPSQPTQTPSVVSLGITSALVGNRADLIIADDVESPNNSATTVMREKLSEAIKEFDAILKPGGRILFLGTPQTEESIYAVLPERGFRVMVWPARYPNAKQRESYGDTLAADIVEDLATSPALEGKSTEPSRFPEEVLLEKEISYGRAGFALQYMLDTSLSDAELYPLRLRDLMVTPLSAAGAPERCVWAGSAEYQIQDIPIVGFRGDAYHRPWVDKDSKFLPFTAVVMAIDPAGRGKDETGWAVVGLLHSTMYLLDAGGVKGYEDESLRLLARKAKEWGANTILHEPNFGDGMFAKVIMPILKEIYPCQLKESERSNAQKEKRIVDVLEPVIAGHRLVVNQDLIVRDQRSTESYPAEIAKTYQLFFQLSHITREKGSLLHDDRIDAVSLGVGFFAQALGRSQQDAAQATRRREWDAELKDHRKNAFAPVSLRNPGEKKKHRNWLAA